MKDTIVLLSVMRFLFVLVRSERFALAWSCGGSSGDTRDKGHITLHPLPGAFSSNLQVQRFAGSASSSANHSDYTPS